MATDIHFYCEHYNEESKRWESLSLYKKKDDGGFAPVPIYDGRDYELFGLLAGVRGGSCLLGNRYGYITEPRGIPSDMSVTTQKAWEEGIEDDGHQWWHGATWYDYCELKNYSYLLNDFAKLVDKRDNLIDKLQEEIDDLKGVEKDDLDFFPYDEEDDEDCEKWHAFKALKSLLGDVASILWEYGIYCSKPGEVRLVMWFDS